MSNNKLERFRNYIIRQISESEYIHVDTCPDTKYSDYYSVFLKNGDRLLTIGSMNIVSFVSQVSNGDCYLTVIFSLPVNDDDADKKSGDRVLEVVHLVEKAVSSCDFIHCKQDKQFFYVHVVKRITVEVYYKLGLVERL